MSARLIILRGPSGAGKSTVASAVQQLARTDTLIIAQDYYRHTLLNNKPDEHDIVPAMVQQDALILLRAGYNVIVEGIFRKEKYLPMLKALLRAFDGTSYIYYFDVSFAETARRHATRDKAALFTAQQMAEWYDMAEPLGITGEYRIPEPSTEAAASRLILAQTGL